MAITISIDQVHMAIPLGQIMEHAATQLTSDNAESVSLSDDQIEDIQLGIIESLFHTLVDSTNSENEAVIKFNSEQEVVVKFSMNTDKVKFKIKDQG